jgi:putative inorganic carbon (HCO3(-)) transporter
VTGLALRAPRAARDAGLALGLGLGAVAAGALLTLAANKVGGAGDAPVLMFGLALAPVVALGVIGHRLGAAILVLAVFPVGSLHLPTPGVSTQLVELTVFIVSALVIIRRLASGLVPLKWSPPLWWALGLLAWAIVATPSAIDLSLALKQDAVLAAGIVFAAVLLATLRDVGDVKVMLGVFLVVAVGIAIAGLSQRVQLQAVSGGESVGGRLTGAFEHPNQLGLFSALAALAATGLAMGASTRPRRVLAAAALPFVLSALLLSLSRGAWIGTGLGFLYLLLKLREARRALLLVGIPFVIVASLFGSFSPGHTDIHVITLRAHALTTLSPYDGRKAIYTEAFHEIRANPIKGVGPGDFPVSSERADSASVTVYADHAHDLWLTWGAEDGLPAVALIVVLTISLGLASSRASRNALRSGELRDRAVMAGLTGGMIAVLGQGIFDYLLRNAVLWMLVWGLIGALLVCARQYGAFGPQPPRGQPVR